MLLTEYLLVKAAEEADELATALIRANLFGIHSDKEGKTPAQEAGEEINDIMTFITLLREEGWPIENLCDTGELESMRSSFGRHITDLAGKDTTEEVVLCKVIGLGAEKASGLVKAFTKALTFGIDSVDPRTEMTGRQKIGHYLNAVMTVLRILEEGGVKIPGIGDGAYMLMRREKAIQGSIEAQRRGIICPSKEVVAVSTEQGHIALIDESTNAGRYNGGVYQSVWHRPPMENPDGVNQQTGGRADIEKVVAIVYGCPSGGDAAPNDIVMIQQGRSDGSHPGGERCVAMAN